MSTQESRDEREPPPREAPEDQPGEIGAEGGSETARRSKLPPMPDEKDDTPFGDSDQHSTG